MMATNGTSARDAARTPIKPDRPVADLYDLCLAVAAQERRVLKLLLPNRRLSAPIVAAAGLDIRHFSQDDHRLIFAGWRLACERDLPLIDTLRLIRRSLQADRLFDSLTPAGSKGMRHSDMTLAELGVHRMTREERDYAVGRGPDDEDPLQRSIARHVVALVSAAESMRRAA